MELEQRFAGNCKAISCSPACIPIFKWIYKTDKLEGLGRKPLFLVNTNGLL
jgi:hypothetical protein